MTTRHAKSACCGAFVQRFGKRRRRCSICQRTWRIRQKRRGRKRRRVNRTLILDYLTRTVPSLRALAAQRGCGKDRMQITLSRSLDAFLADQGSRWIHELPESGSLIAVADAIWYYVDGEKYSIYVILLRPVNATRAVICPPIVLPGHEHLAGWRAAVDRLPSVLQKRIIALVCDGATSLVALSRERHWILQRCHFHLLAAVQNYLTTGPRSTHQAYAKRVLGIVQTFVTTTNPRIRRAMREKIFALRTRSSSRGLRRVLGGLLRDYRDYLTYRRYPQLDLPTTSNTAESWIQCIRDLMYRARGFRSLRTLTKWLTALALVKRTIVCNGKHQPN